MTLKTMMLPALLIVLIASTVIVHVVMLVVATRDQSFAVTGGGDRDESWSERVRKKRENERLGWSATATLTAPTAPGGPAMLEIAMLDDDARPLRGARVRVTAFHKARPNERVEADLGERGEGRYVGALVPARAGVWRVALRAGIGEELFAEAIDVELPEARSEEDSR
ncbi:MAG: FixH family protein [Planctomycetota bacterium]|jgi:hypothetical protein